MCDNGGTDVTYVTRSHVTYGKGLFEPGQAPQERRKRRVRTAIG
jgi:hypothetical protein